MENTVDEKLRGKEKLNEIELGYIQTVRKLSQNVKVEVQSLSSELNEARKVFDRKQANILKTFIK